LLGLVWGPFCPLGLFPPLACAAKVGVAACRGRVGLKPPPRELHSAKTLLAQPKRASLARCLGCCLPPQAALASLARCCAVGAVALAVGGGRASRAPTALPWAVGVPPLSRRPGSPGPALARDRPQPTAWLGRGARGARDCRAAGEPGLISPRARSVGPAKCALIGLLLKDGPSAGPRRRGA
jgi:hypothetical protein